MLKVLVWRVSNDTTFQDNALKILERQHDGIEIVGAVSEDISNLKKEFDVILCVGAKKLGMSKVTQDAKQLNLPEEKLLGDWIVCIPGFTLEKYRQLQRSRLSIFAVNCIGGFFSNALGLPFLSPFVNLWLSNDDFYKFLLEPHSYMEKPLTYKGKTFNAAKTFEFPVAMLGDITLNLMHYKTFEEATNAWETRKKRINWNNLIAMMWSLDEKSLWNFDKLPYSKKVCFVPFKSNLDSAFYIEPRLTEKLPRFVDIVNAASQGNPFYYDVFDMLLYGKKTPLIEM